MRPWKGIEIELNKKNTYIKNPDSAPRIILLPNLPSYQAKETIHLTNLIIDFIKNPNQFLNL